MNQLENLLNSLIKMGWKPWGLEYTTIDIVDDGREECLMFWNVPKRHMKAYTFRELVSLESGLWQFCEKNGLLHEYYNGRNNIHPYKFYWTTTYEYRLIESALVPEEELGQFLVDNIKVEGTSK